MVNRFDAGRSREPSVQMAEVLAISDEVNKNRSQFDLDDFDDDKPMTKAEFLMAQIDLDPIESQYSQEQKQISVHHSQVHQTTAASNARSGMARIGSGIIPKQSTARSKGREGAHNEYSNPEGFGAMGGNAAANVNNTMATGSFNSVSQGKSIQSSMGNDPAAGSMDASAVFKSPGGSAAQAKAITKPPMMTKSG